MSEQITLNHHSTLCDMLQDRFPLDDVTRHNLSFITEPQYKRFLALMFNHKDEELKEMFNQF